MKVANRLLAAAAVLGLVGLTVSEAQAFGHHHRRGCGGGCSTSYSSCGCSSGYTSSSGCSSCTSAPVYTSTSSCGCNSGGTAYSSGGYSQGYATGPSQDYNNLRQANRPPAPTDDLSGNARDSGSIRSGGESSVMSRGGPPPVPEPSQQ
jgi:hypothetical protein